jgi:hypothetical protein
MTNNKAEIIAQLNDEHRRLGAYCLTAGCLNLEHSDLQVLIKSIKFYNDFDAGNDPYGERDFGTVEVNEDKFLWKIDYYNMEGAGFSKDPADRTVTKRVLTVMRADEY